MKKIILLVGIFLVNFHVLAQDLKLKKEVVFQEGEVLTYKLKYGFITAGEGKIKILPSDLMFDTKPTYRISVDVRTSGTFDIFYKIRDHYDSYVDRQNLTPYFYQENIREGRYQRQDKARFYQDTKKVVSNRGNFDTETNQTFDLVSTYYFARNLDLSKTKIGDRIKFNYFLGDAISTLQIEYVGREVIETKIGKLKCLKFIPSINPGRVFKKDSKMFLWVTDDENRIPVKAEVEILVGSVKLEIDAVNGLKHPLSVQEN
ncbi:MAG: DUF3108 domain-containing protein [Sphingobacteriaceae bacterium]|nr:DUF3108 domain-containing protein [Sphingobacteriaceae bacterium]